MMSKKKDNAEEIKEELEQETSAAEETPAEEQKPTEEQLELEKYKNLSEEYMHMAQRERADLENYKRRNANVRAEAYDDGVRECATHLLPVMDNLERALAAAEKTQDFASLSEGLKNIAKQFAAALAEVNVTPIEALNCPFDPEIHNAVLHTEEEGVPENTVTEEMMKGYMYKDKVLRHSMVKVAN